MGTFEIASGISIILFIAYLGWGIVLLHLKFNKHEELNPVVEAATLGAIILFYSFELALFNVVFQQNRLMMALAVIGLVLSGLALYGPVVMSLASHAVVGMLMPSGDRPTATPHFGAAERYEEIEDYENALNEYMTVAKMFPNNPTAALRVGNNLARMGRYDEAVEWFERGMLGVNEPEDCLVTVNRVVEIATRHLDDKEAAERALVFFMERFPDSQYADTAARRLKRVKDGETQGFSSDSTW